MQYLLFTVVAIVLYVASSWILERLEAVLGHRLPYRSVIFFALLMTLALSSFALIRRYTGIP